MKQKKSMIDALQKQFPQAWFDDADYFYERKQKGIITGKGAKISDVPLFDPTGLNWKTHLDDVHEELESFLAEKEWYAEPYDSDTVILYPISDK